MSTCGMLVCMFAGVCAGAGLCVVCMETDIGGGGERGDVQVLGVDVLPNCKGTARAMFLVLHALRASGVFT